MHDANERKGDHLPWVRGNDLMPARSASAYARIPVAIDRDRAPASPTPAHTIADDAPSVATDIPPTAADRVADDAPCVATDIPTTAVTSSVGRLAHRFPSGTPANDPRFDDSDDTISPASQTFAVMWALVAVLALVLAGAALAIALATVLLPSSAHLGAAVVAAMLAGLATYPVVRWALLLWGFRRFHVESLEPFTSPRSSTLREVGRRAALQSKTAAPSGGRHAIRAQRSLRRYLASHPLGKNRDRQVRVDLEISGDTLTALKRRKDELLRAWWRRTEQGMQPDDWVKAFDEGFLATLDELSLRRVEEHSWRTFKAVAASPNGVFDALVTMWSGSAMVQDLGRIYNLRTGRVGGAVLLGRLLIDHNSIPIANLPDPDPDREPEAEGAGAMDETRREGGFRTILERRSMASTATEIGSLVANGAYEFGLRAEPAVVHYFQMRKLGARAIRILRPLV